MSKNKNRANPPFGPDDNQRKGPTGGSNPPHPDRNPPKGKPQKPPPKPIDPISIAGPPGPGAPKPISKLSASHTPHQPHSKELGPKPSPLPTDKPGPTRKDKGPRPREESAGKSSPVRKGPQKWERELDDILGHLRLTSPGPGINPKDRAREGFNLLGGQDRRVFSSGKEAEKGGAGQEAEFEELEAELAEELEDWLNLIGMGLTSLDTEVVLGAPSPMAGLVLQGLLQDVTHAFKGMVGDSEEFVDELVVVWGQIPWAGEVAIGLYHQLIEGLDLPKIFGVLQDLGEVDLMVIAKSQYVGEVARALAANYPAHPQLVEEFLSLDVRLSREELRLLGITRHLSVMDAYDLLVVLLQGLVEPTHDHELVGHRRVMVWLGGLENLLSYSERERRELLKALSALQTGLIHYFTLVLNFGPGENEAATDELNDILEEYSFMDLVTIDLINGLFEFEEEAAGEDED